MLPWPVNHDYLFPGYYAATAAPYSPAGYAYARGRQDGYAGRTPRPYDSPAYMAGWRDGRALAHTTPPVRISEPWRLALSRSGQGPFHF